MWWFENLIEKSNFVRVPWKYALTKQSIKFQSSGEGGKKWKTESNNLTEKGEIRNYSLQMQARRRG